MGSSPDARLARCGIAAIGWDVSERLPWSQTAVAALALAGLA
jgi:hypothetical protein